MLYVENILVFVARLSLILIAEIRGMLLVFSDYEKRPDKCDTLG